MKEDLTLGNFIHFSGVVTLNTYRRYNSFATSTLVLVRVGGVNRRVGGQALIVSYSSDSTSSDVQRVHLLAPLRARRPRRLGRGGVGRHHALQYHRWSHLNYSDTSLRIAVFNTGARKEQLGLFSYLFKEIEMHTFEMP